MTNIHFPIIARSHDLHRPHWGLHRQGKREHLTCMCWSRCSCYAWHYKVLHCNLAEGSFEVLDSHTFFPVRSRNLFFLSYFSLPICMGVLHYFHCIDQSHLFPLGITNLNSDFTFWNSHQLSYLLWPNKHLTYGFRNGTSKGPLFKCHRCDCDFLIWSFSKLFTDLRFHSPPSFF